MSVNVTLLDKSGTETDGTTLVSASVTPTGNRLQLLAVESEKGATPDAPTSVVGCGITWVQVGTALLWADNASPTRRITLWRGLVASPTPGSVTITFPATQTGMELFWVEVDGIDTGGANGANAVVQFGSNFSDTAVQSFGVTLAAFGNSSNGVIAFFGRSSNTTSTPKTGYTDLGFTGHANPSIALSAEWLVSADTNPTISWTTSAVKAGGVAVELKSLSTQDPGQAVAWVSRIEKLQTRVSFALLRALDRQRQGVDESAFITRLRNLETWGASTRSSLLSDGADIDSVIAAIEAEKTGLAAEIAGAGATPKSLLKGPLTRSGFSGDANVVGYNPEITWNTLQPNGFGTALVTSAIDTIIAAHPGAFRLRLMAGAGDCPSWLLASAGSMSFTNPQNGASGTVPCWWTNAYVDAFADLQARLAAAYDTVAAFKFIFCTGGMTIYAEPCRKGFTYGGNVAQNIAWAAANRAAALANGYVFGPDTVVGSDQWANLQFLNAMKVWQQTRIGYAFSGYEELKANGSAAANLGYTGQLMQAFRNAFGSRMVLQNNSIRDSYIANPAGPRPYRPNLQLLKDIAAMGPPISFQTAATVGVTTGFTDLNKTTQFAVDMGAHAVEWPGNFSSLTTQQKSDLKAELQANP